MGKSCPKELFKIARCFRSYFVSLFESFQKVTERSRMLVTIQTRILNTFSKQGTKIIKGNIMWVSNFHMDMYGNVLKFWCYDPNLCSPGQGGFYRFTSLFDSQLLIVKRPPKQPDKLIICSEMFYCCYLRKKEKNISCVPLENGCDEEAQVNHFTEPPPSMRSWPSWSLYTLVKLK